ncbi:phage tail protein [Halomonas sp. Mc5H-6]|uniref:phage tail protein n=1 Tax=Halomonas sp. Mc5H-6 TaxID=2954500 RepID=UPI00209718CB|nr:phage tail protein [Halomonas sp. Mc5H-6]MCO7246353.1 phage tail protein [Halomonas sp. Mc5H-6]
MDILPNIPASYSPSVSPEFSVDRVQFGDGYEQRREAGANSVRESWSLEWSALKRERYDILYPFLKSRKGVHAFYWQPPWEHELKRWVCSELSSVRPIGPNLGSITATLVEDHNP